MREGRGERELTQRELAPNYLHWAGCSEFKANLNYCYGEERAGREARRRLAC